MSDVYFMEVVKEALYLLLLLSLPPLGAALIAGLVSALLQASTRVWDPAIALLPRVGAVLLALVLAGPWTADQLVSFSQLLWQGIPRLR